MKVFCAVSLLGAILVAVPVSAAQHNIVISDSLAANADTLIVKQGAQSGRRIWKWRIGDYEVVSSKMGPTAMRKRGDRTGAESTSTGGFSFVLTNRTADSAMVNAVHSITVHSLQDAGQGSGWTLGRHDDVVLDSANGAASITLNGDTTDTWALQVGVTMGDRQAAIYRAALSNGKRRIVISPASSKTHGRFGVLGSAAGYEFSENGQSLCALQYFGGKFGNTTLVWMLRSLDARTKLLLAAAMTAVLQMKSMEGGQ